MKFVPIALITAGLLGGCATALAPNRTVDVQLLAINDLHGRLEPPGGAEGRVGETPAGGIEYLATHLKAAAATNPNTLIVAAGDLFGASPLLSATFDDAPTTEAVDALGVMATALGNHELDRGPEAFARTLAGHKVRYLAANVTRTGPPPSPLLPPMWIAEVGGAKVGFIGEILHDAPSVIAAKAIRGLSFADEADAANAAVAVLHRQGVRAIVLLVHEGGLQANAMAADPNGCEDLKGAILPVLERLSPAIKVVISGHSHLPYNCRIAGRTVTNAGAYGRGYTVLRLKIDAASNAILDVSATNRTTTRGVARDPAQTAILAKYRPRVAELMARPVGSASGAMAREFNAAGESPLGDVVADADLASAREWAPAAQIAFTNTGGLRAGLGSATVQGEQPVTHAQLYDVQPFGNQLMAVTLTGDGLRRLLEAQWDATGRDILQVSSGFTYRYRQAAPVGQHIEAGSIRLNGRPVRPDGKVRIVLSDFLFGRAKPGTPLSEATDPVMGPSDLDALLSYFATRSPVAPGRQDRIVRLD